MSRRKNKSGFGCGFVFFCVIAIFVTLVVILSMNPTKLQESIKNLTEKVEEYVNKLGGNSEAEQDNIEFPEEEKLTEAQRYYYYQQLDGTAKKIYLSIEKNIDNLKDGQDNIPLPSSLNDDAKNNSKGKEYIAEQFQNAWDAFITDKSEYFYLDSSKVCLVTKMTTKGSNTNYEFFIGKGDNKNYFIDEFKDKSEVESAIKKVNNVKTEILKNATGNNYEKMKYVHDWIVDNANYETSKGSNTSNIYGCLVNKKVICEGYARAFKYLMDELNIPCILVSGTAIDENGKSERHAWNYVYIKNNWYAIDTTWDDPIIIGKGKVDSKIKYKYFLKGSDEIGKNHIPIGEVTKNGMKFKYPELSKENIK